MKKLIIVYTFFLTAMAIEGQTTFEKIISDPKNQIAIIAETSHSTAGSMARGILEMQYGHHFCDCLNTAGNEGFKSSQAYNPDAFNKMFGGKIDVNPNPASEWAAFDYTLPETAGKGVIKISDATGKLVKFIEVSGVQGQYVWDTREVKPGVYFYTFVVNGTGNTAKHVITK